MIETAERNFEENFEMKKKDFNYIEKLKKNRRDAQNSLRNAAKSINEKNKIFKNNIMIINLD